jgi:hypothetical protein
MEVLMRVLAMLSLRVMVSSLPRSAGKDRGYSADGVEQLESLCGACDGC